MIKFPFQLSIKSDYPEKRIETLLCIKILRNIPGRRQVYDAQWQGRSVIAKVFSHNISAKRHFKREWWGLNELTRRELSSPTPLFFGKTEDGQWAIVMEKIDDSSTALDVLNKTSDKIVKLDLLILACRELAKQHSNGVLQKDLHLGNFLLRRGILFTLDPAGIHFSRREIGRTKSISHLALLACSLPAGDEESIRQICQEYFKTRCWPLEKQDEALFRKRLTTYRKHGIRHGLKKRMRSGTKYLRIKSVGHLAVFDREFCAVANPVDFIKQIDSLMDKGEIIKNGNTTYVSRLSINGKDIVVKRYNHKGFIHSVRHTIKKSRALRGWLHAHRLRMLKVATPKPLAYIENRRGLLLWQSYLVTEYVKGQMLRDFLRDNNATKEKRSMVTRQVTNLLDKLGQNRITHGDLKHSNILITENEPVLIDIDAMKVHRWTWLFDIKRAKDLSRVVQDNQSNR